MTSKEKRHMSLAVIGHDKVGKSTTIQHLMDKCGGAGTRTVQKLEVTEPGKGALKYALVLDQLKAERERGITIDIAMWKFESPKSVFTIVDVPASQEVVKSVITTNTSSQPDAAILVIDSGPGEFEAGYTNNGHTCQLVSVAFSLGVTQIVVACSKMDVVNFSEARYYEIVLMLSPYIKKVGYSLEKVRFVPISGLARDNITEKSTRMQWYKGPTLLEILDLLDRPNRSSNRQRPPSAGASLAAAAPADSSWTCPMCTYANSVQIPTCEMCGTARSEPLALPPPAVAVVTATKKDLWECSICTLMNPVSATVCAACEIERPSSCHTLPRLAQPALLPQKQQRAKTTAAVPAAVPSTAASSWPCPTCTFKNSAQTPMCDMCATPQTIIVHERPSPPRPAASLVSSPTVCLVCTEELSPSHAFACGAGHEICHPCFSRYIIETWAVRAGEPGDVPVLRCAQPGCPTGPLLDTQVARNATEEALGTYLEVRQRARDANTFARAQQIMDGARREKKSEAEQRLLEEQLRNQFPESRQCPRCLTGPIDARGCDDLQAHHGQQVNSGAARISNSCPKCGFFTPNLKDWPRWDGKLRDSDKDNNASSADAIQFVVGAMRCTESAARAAVNAVRGSDFGETVSAAVEFLTRCSSSSGRRAQSASSVPPPSGFHHHHHHYDASHQRFSHHWPLSQQQERWQQHPQQRSPPRADVEAQQQEAQREAYQLQREFFVQQQRHGQFDAMAYAQFWEEDEDSMSSSDEDEEVANAPRPKLSWNEFRRANAGRGYGRDGNGPGSMSYAYQNQ